MNRFRHFIVFVFLSTFAVFSASAASVAIQIIQHDVKDAKIRDSVYEVESNLFDYFFNKGIIISNTPIVVTDGTKAEDAKHFRQALGFARQGGVDFFVEMTGDFDLNDGKIRKFSWKIIDVNEDKDVAGGSLGPSKKKSKLDDVDIGIFTADIADEIYSSILKYGM